MEQKSAGIFSILKGRSKLHKLLIDDLDKWLPVAKMTKNS